MNETLYADDSASVVSIDGTELYNESVMGGTIGGTIGGTTGSSSNQLLILVGLLAVVGGGLMVARD